MNHEESPPPDKAGAKAPENDAPVTPLADLIGQSRPEELVKRLESHRPASPRHRIESKIAQGGMGVIHRAVDIDLGRELAMKSPPDWIGTRTSEERERLLARFLEEAQVTGQLHHPGIVPVHELSIDAAGKPYFTMPLIRGWDLTEIIQMVKERRDRWTLPRALGVLLKVCEAVAYAHSRGVIHRDLKPSNVRVGRYGETYVMDWGLARVLGRRDVRDLRLRDDGLSRASVVRTERAKQREEDPDSPIVTMDGDVVGTPYYMSPEQARGEIEKLDARSDVYSVGAMLYHLLAGHPAYTPPSGKISARTALARVIDGPPQALRELAPDAPGELIEISEKAMSRDPAQRYADTLEMAADIEAFLGRRPVRAHAPSVAYALRLVFERNRVLVLTCVAAILTLAVAGGVFLVRLSEARAAEESSRQTRVDVLAARALRRDADELWPAVPDRAGALSRWLAAVDDLATREQTYVSGAQSESGSDKDLAALVLDLSSLHRLRPQIAQRLERARDLARVSLAEPATAWDQAIASIAASKAYGGLRIRPQLGLVPLWENPRTGLWDFWHVESGTRPRTRISDSGDVTLDDTTGIVLVLLPGGEFDMGSPPEEQGRMAGNETLHRVSIQPFFIARHEVTQGQWTRTMGEDPARFCSADRSDRPFGPLHPVESVTWHQCAEFSRRIGARLALEAEWEYAARAGSQTAYACGDDFTCLDGRENILDQSAGDELGSTAPWFDEYRRTAPVGSLAANAFGLYDMQGNVSEWCADLYRQDYVGDEFSPCIQMRVFRGGSWYLKPAMLATLPMRSAYRQWDNAQGLNQTRGVRIARTLDP